VDAGAVAFTSEREDMETSNIDGKYLKSAAVVASELGAKGVMPFIGGDSNAAVVFTFAQVPEALLYIMPMKQPTACLPAPTVNFYSPQAMRDTVTMLRDRAKKARQRATTSKDKTYVEFTLKRAARLEGKADSLAATLSVKIEGPKVDAQAPTAATEQPQG